MCDYVCGVRVYEFVTVCTDGYTSETICVVVMGAMVYVCACVCNSLCMCERDVVIQCNVLCVYS